MDEKSGSSKHVEKPCTLTHETNLLTKDVFGFHNVFKVTSCWAFFVLREEMSSEVPEKPGGLVLTLGIEYG
jgi:hypothetical protein